MNAMFTEIVLSLWAYAPIFCHRWGLHGTYYTCRSLMDIMFIKVTLIILSGLTLNVYFQLFFIFTPILNKIMLMYFFLMFGLQFNPEYVNSRGRRHSVRHN